MENFKIIPWVIIGGLLLVASLGLLAVTGCSSTSNTTSASGAAEAKASGNGSKSSNQRSQRSQADSDYTVYVDDNKAEQRKAALLNVEMGETYLAQGQVARAKQKLVHALKLVPDLPEGLTAMGYFWEKVGENAEAEKYYKKAIAKGNGHGAFYNNYGSFLCRAGRYAAADQAFVSAINDRNYLNTAEVYENAGLCAVLADKPEQAETYFNKAIRYDAKSYRAWLELTDLAFKAGDVDKASNYLRTFRKQVEPTPRLLWLSIQIARVKQEHDVEASETLLLKNMFADSNEYRLYIQSSGNN